MRASCCAHFLPGSGFPLCMKILCSYKYRQSEIHVQLPEGLLCLIWWDTSQTAGRCFKMLQQKKSLPLLAHKLSLERRKQNLTYREWDHIPRWTVWSGISLQELWKKKRATFQTNLLISCGSYPCTEREVAQTTRVSYISWHKNTQCIYSCLFKSFFSFIWWSKNWCKVLMVH